MKKQPPLTFTFENPNSPADFEAALKKILLEKLSAELAQGGRLCPSSVTEGEYL